MSSDSARDTGLELRETLLPPAASVLLLKVRCSAALAVRVLLLPGLRLGCISEPPLVLFSERMLGVLTRSDEDNEDDPLGPSSSARWLLERLFSLAMLGGPTPLL